MINLYLSARQKNDDKPKSRQCMVSNCAGSSTNFAQMTFSHGQRSCIGKDFAEAVLRCIVTGLIGRYKMRLDEPGKEFRFAGYVAVRMMNVHLRLKQVDGW